MELPASAGLGSPAQGSRSSLLQTALKRDPSAFLGNVPLIHVAVAERRVQGRMANSPVHHSEGIHVAVGGTFFGIGWGGILTLLIAAAVSPTAPPASGLIHLWWYFPAVGISVFFVIVGAWFIGGVYWPILKLPRTALAREMVPKIGIAQIAMLRTAGARVWFRVGFHNSGRGDLTDATVNIVVPDLGSFWQCDLNGNDYAPSQPTSESICTDSSGKPIPSAYWIGRSMTFPGRTAYPIDFRMEMVPALTSFPVLVRLTAADLDEPLTMIGEVKP